MSKKKLPKWFKQYLDGLSKKEDLFKQIMEAPIIDGLHKILSSTTTKIENTKKVILLFGDPGKMLHGFLGKEVSHEMMIAAKADAKKLLALAKKHEKFLINFRNDLRKEVPKKNALIEESAIDAIMDVFDRHIEPLQMAQTTFFHASNKSVFGAAHKSKRIRAAGKEGGSRPKKKQGIQALAEELVTKYPKSTEEALWRKTSNYSSEDPFETDRFQVYRDEDKLVQFDGAINKETAIASGTFHKEYIRPLKK